MINKKTTPTPLDFFCKTGKFKMNKQWIYTGYDDWNSSTALFQKHISNNVFKIFFYLSSPQNLVFNLHTTSTKAALLGSHREIFNILRRVNLKHSHVLCNKHLILAFIRRMFIKYHVAIKSTFLPSYWCFICYIPWANTMQSKDINVVTWLI